MPSWRATYSDGSRVFDGPGRYAELDRKRLELFDVYLGSYDLMPILTIEVPKGRRLVHRQRVWPKTGDRVLMCGTENEDRSEVDIHLVRLADGFRGHLTAYGDDAMTGAPVLYDGEVVR